MRNVVVHREFLGALFMINAKNGGDVKFDKYHENTWNAVHNLSVDPREYLDNVARYPLHGDKRLIKHNNAAVVWGWSGDEVHVYNTYLITADD